MKTNQIIKIGESKNLSAGLRNYTIDSIITSPPYWAQRDYGIDGQIGIEETYNEYIKKLIDVFDILKLKLKKSGNCFIVINDTYISNWGACRKSSWWSSKTDEEGLGWKKVETKIKPNLLKKNKIPVKSLSMIPGRLAINMIDKGWILRNIIIWNKPNFMKEIPVHDRLNKSYEFIFHFVVNNKYYYNFDDLKSLSNVWNINSTTDDEHYATFPIELVKKLILMSCPENGVVLDPFCGSGTTLAGCKLLNINGIGFDINPYCEHLTVKKLDEIKEYTISEEIKEMEDMFL